MTLYASSKDLALQASQLVHGNPRAGDSGDGLVVVDGIETIDASTVTTGFLGHSYFAEVTSVMSDIYYLIRHSNKADDRFGLMRAEAADGRCWKFKNR